MCPELLLPINAVLTTIVDQRTWLTRVQTTGRLPTTWTRADGC